MKRLLTCLGIVGTVIMVICDMSEFLAIPAILVVIGILNSLTWQYYVISIGGYVLLFVAAELIAHFVFKSLDKKYSPIIARKLEKYFGSDKK